MPYEPTLKGNPQQLTVEQHFHTAHAISKLYNEAEKVQVKFIASEEVVERHKRAKIFCTKRTWDERAEKGYMAAIEKESHNQIDNIRDYSSRCHESISRYFLLWRLRFAYHTTPNQDIVLNGIVGPGLAKEQEEILESKWCMFNRENGVVSSRFSTSLQLQMELDRSWEVYSRLKWGLLEATDGEFLVADGYDDLTFMPIAPNIAFAAGVEDHKISKEKVSELNNCSIAKATEYVFARNFSACPIG